MSRRLGTAAAAMALLLSSAGCGKDEDASTNPSPSVPATTQEASPTPDATPAAPEATGPRVTTSRFTFRVPKGFEVRDVAGEYLSSARDLMAGDTIFYGIIDGTTKTSLDRLTRILLDTRLYDREPAALKHETLDGREVYHLSGQVDDLRHVDAYGLWRDGDWVDVTFELMSPPERRAEIIDSVLATFEWRD